MINLTVSEAIYLYSVYDELVSAATAHPIPDRVSFAGVRTELQSEIDRVVPAKFGIDDTWGAIPIGGELRARQTRAILVAAALYDTRRRQLLAALHGTAAEPAAKRQRTEETL